MAKQGRTTEVEIFGSVYAVRGQQKSGEIKKLARLVDERMREIARHVSTTDAEKIAILASLNIADELMQCQRRVEGEQQEISERAIRLTGILEQALEATG